MKHRRSKILAKAVRRDESGAAIVALRPDRRRIDVELARHFHDVKVHYHYVYESCASIREYGEKHGFSSREATTLAAVGNALALNPEIEPRLLDGRITLHAAAALARVFRDPQLVRDDDDWLLKAETAGLRQLHLEISERVVEVYEKGPPSRLEVVMSYEDREAFERAREVASEKEKQVLREGRVIGVLANHYLDSFDPDRVEEGKRRVGDTAHRRGRYIPASVKRKVRRRSGGVCQWPRCQNRLFLNFVHRKWHSRGGSREPRNLQYLCPLHHALLDEGWIRLGGSAKDPVFYERVVAENGEMKWAEVRGLRDPPE